MSRPQAQLQSGRESAIRLKFITRRHMIVVIICDRNKFPHAHAHRRRHRSVCKEKRVCEKNGFPTCQYIRFFFIS